MSNGARHGLGVLLGLIAAPLLALGLAVGMDRLFQAMRYSASTADRYSWAAVLLALGLAAGLLAGSRLSPLASLLPGLLLSGLGLLWLLAFRRMAELSEPLPDEVSRAFLNIGGMGAMMVVGALLVAASLSPSRWKGRRPAAAQPRHAAPSAQAPEPMGPPPGPPQYGRQQLPQYEQNPRLGAPGQGAPGHAAPGHAAPGQNAPGQHAPGQGGRPPSGAVPFDDEPKQSRKGDEDDPGEWTQMYGGGR
ncbi:hypothetical protein ACQEU3_11920 [Spirillospora sp. CA-253888]